MRDAADARERRHILHNSFEGAVGGFRVVDAGSGAHQAFRVQLGAGAFAVSDWLQPGEPHRHLSGQLAFSWTPFSFLELFGRYGSWRDSTYSPDSAYFNHRSSSAVGVKAFHSPRPWVTVGGDVSLAVPINMVQDIGRVARSTSVGVRANAAVDLRERQGPGGPLPLIGRLNVGRVFDRSGNLLEGLESARYEALPVSGDDARAPVAEEHRHLVAPVEQFGLQIDRVDRYTVGIGIEAPIGLGDLNMTVSPVAELVADLPAARGRFDCPVGAGGDSCLDRAGGAAFRRSMVAGVRVLPPLRGMNVFGAVEVGLTGVRNPVRELAAQEPYRLLFGFSYAFDSRSRSGG